MDPRQDFTGCLDLVNVEGNHQADQLVRLGIKILSIEKANSTKQMKLLKHTKVVSIANMSEKYFTHQPDEMY